MIKKEYINNKNYFLLLYYLERSLFECLKIKMPKGQGDEINTEAPKKRGFASKLSDRVGALFGGSGSGSSSLYSTAGLNAEEAAFAFLITIVVIAVLIITAIVAIVIFTGVEEIVNKIASGVEKMGNTKKPKLEPEKSLKPVLPDTQKEAEKNSVPFSGLAMDGVFAENFYYARQEQRKQKENQKVREPIIKVLEKSQGNEQQRVRYPHITAFRKKRDDLNTGINTPTPKKLRAHKQKQGRAKGVPSR